MKFYKVCIIFLFLLVLSMGVVCAQDTNKTAHDTFQATDDDMMSDALEGTYTDLSNKINTTDSTVKLDINYKYNDTDKGKEYIKIVNRNLTIEGNNKDY